MLWNNTGDLSELRDGLVLVNGLNDERGGQRTFVYVGNIIINKLWINLQLKDLSMSSDILNHLKLSM